MGVTILNILMKLITMFCILVLFLIYISAFIKKDFYFQYHLIIELMDHHIMYVTLIMKRYISIVS